MKLKLALAAAAAFAAPVAMPAMAQQANMYVNGGYTHFDGDSGQLGGVTGRVGVGFGQHFAVEGEATVGVKDDGAVELDNQIGLYAVGKLPVTNRFDVFGRVGATRVDTNFGDDEGLAYGVGANYYFTEKDGIRADITRHELDNSDTDAYSVSYTRRF